MKRAIIIGAGIVGLHVAYQLNQNKYEVYVLDQEPYLAEHTSGRNTGVIHAGIYYKEGSLKEKLCIEGNRLTYEWLDKLKVPYLSCGKWVTADQNQNQADIEIFYDKIKTLPIPTPSLFTGSKLSKLEPILKQEKAIFVPSSGVLNAADYVKALAIFLQKHNITILLNCKVTQINKNTLQTSRGPIDFDIAINCAGLFCDDVGNMTGLSNYHIKPCRGDYFQINKKLINKPIYHLPHKESLGLGLHLTPALDNQTLIGPNAYFIDDKKDYHHKSDETLFYESANFHLKNITKDMLTKAYSGNRPKLFKKDKPVDDFTIIQDSNWIHLLGIESPGLTAAPALAGAISKFLV